MEKNAEDKPSVLDLWNVRPVFRDCEKVYLFRSC